MSPIYAGQEFKLIQGATRPVHAEDHVGEAGESEEIDFRLEISSGAAVAMGTITLASPAPGTATA